jgi:hypothetical protein
MFPGGYSGVVSPGDHYIVLEKDFSNMDEVATKLKDDQFMTDLTERAHDHLVKSGRWSYLRFVQDFDDLVADAAEKARGPSRTPRHRLARMERTLRVPPVRVRVVRGALAVGAAVRGRDFARRSEIESGTWLAKGALALRAALGDADLRAVFREGRRAGMALDSLLEEILELSLLRRAAAGTLPAKEKFTVASEFDIASGSLRFVSREMEEGPQSTERPSAAVLEALRTGAVGAIELDHSEVGRTVRLERPLVDIGIGSAGVTTYPLLVAIGRRRPKQLERALAPVIGTERIAASRLS